MNTIDYESSEELCAKLAAENDTVILAFSTGKDSIASWLQLRKYFKRIIPFYKYLVPGLQFVEDSLKYYEDFFGCHIYRFPNPALYRILRNAIFQPPYRLEVIADKVFVEDELYNDLTVPDMICAEFDLPDNTYTAIGVRAADNPMRYMAVKQNGAINYNKYTFYPIYDWKKDNLLHEIDEAGIQLPIDYDMFGRTFDGLHYSFQKPLKEHFPEDYKRFLKFFPLADIELARWEGVDKHNKPRNEVAEYEQMG